MGQGDTIQATPAGQQGPTPPLLPRLSLKHPTGEDPPGAWAPGRGEWRRGTWVQAPHFLPVPWPFPSVQTLPSSPGPRASSQDPCICVTHLLPQLKSPWCGIWILHLISIYSDVTQSLQHFGHGLGGGGGRGSTRVTWLIHTWGTTVVFPGPMPAERTRFYSTHSPQSSRACREQDVRQLSSPRWGAQ